MQEYKLGQVEGEPTKEVKEVTNIEVSVEGVEDVKIETPKQGKKKKGSD